MESTPEDMTEGLAIVRVLAAVLERLVVANQAQAPHAPITKFHAMKAPGISIEQYLERYGKRARSPELVLTSIVRILKYASCSNECFIISLMYIDRLIQRNSFVLTELNIHRVVVTSILLAAKFFDDAYYNNAYYARVGGVLANEMNSLEVDFLFRINFSLHFSPEEFEQYREALMAHTVTNVVTPEMSAVAAPPSAMVQPVMMMQPLYTDAHAIMDEEELWIKNQLEEPIMDCMPYGQSPFEQPTRLMGMSGVGL